MNVHIERLATPLPDAASADGAALAALEAATQDRPLPLPGVLAEASAAVGGVVLVARAQDGTLVGMASARPGVGEAHVIRIAVVEAARGRGVGRALIDGLVGWARGLPAAALLLEVRAGNVAARTLYASAGFVVDGRRTGYYPDGEDAELWRLPLDVAAGPASPASPAAGRG